MIDNIKKGIIEKQMKMNKIEHYQGLINEGKNVLEHYFDFRKNNNSIESMALVRETFENLSLKEAKEIMIICETNFGSIEDYQNSLLDDLKGFDDNKGY